MNPRKFGFLAPLIYTSNLNVHSSDISPANIPTKAIEETLVSKKEQMLQQLKWFEKLTPREYGELRGRKLDFIERISFRLNQHRIKQVLKHDNWDEPTSLQKISWLIKGLLLGPIAVLLGYIFLKDDDKELIKWTWFGFIGWAIILAIVLISL